MKKLLETAALLAILSSGCGGASGEPLVTEQIQLLNERAEALEKGDAAKAAELQTKLTDVQKKLDDLKLSDDAKKKLDDQYKSDLDKAAARMIAVEAPPHDKVIQDRISTLNQMADALDKQDVGGLKAALNNMKSIKEQTKKLNEPSKELGAELAKKYGLDVLEAGMKLAKAQKKIWSGDNQEIQNILLGRQ